MNDDTATVRICARCQQPSSEATPVGEVHAASGPGRTIYACPDCAHHYPRHATPMAALEIALRRGSNREGA